MALLSGIHRLPRTELAWLTRPEPCRLPEVFLSRDLDIYARDLITGITTRVTHSKNKGEAASGRDRAMWTLDSAWIGFTAHTSSTPRRALCSTFVNTEIFLIKANGTGTASQITNTNGTSVEAHPKWGW